MIESVLIQFLLSNKNVNALVGARVRPVQLAQTDKLPAIVVTKVGQANSYTMKGLSGLSASRFQIDCWGTSYAETKKVSDAVAAAFLTFPPTVQGAFLNNEADSSEDADTARIFRTRLDYNVIHTKEYT